LWRWWRGGGVVGIGVGGGSRKSGEEEAGGLGRRHNWLESQSFQKAGYENAMSGDGFQIRHAYTELAWEEEDSGGLVL